MAEVLTSSHAPAVVGGRSGNARCCHSMVSSRSPSTRSRSPLSGRPGAHLQPAHGQQDRAVLVQHIEVGLDAGGVGSVTRA